MRILMSIHHELDADAGAPGATLRLAGALRDAGNSVRVLSFDDLGGAPSTRRYRFPWAMTRLVRDAGPADVLDLSSGDGWQLAWRERKRRDRPLIVARSHGLEHVADRVARQQHRDGNLQLSWKYGLYNGGYRLWECAESFRRADLSLFLNRDDMAFATDRLGVPAARARLVRNGIAAPFLARARALQAAQPPGAPFGVAFIGSFVHRKGIATLVPAMTQILSTHVEATLSCLGTGVAAAQVLERFPAVLRPRITVVPRFDNANLPDLLCGSHILAFPSLSEGFALTPIEAMACGLVPVVSDVPGARDGVHHGLTGMVVPVGDAPALAGAIAALLREPLHWQVLRAGALQAVREYAWPEIACATEALYAEFAGRGVGA